MTKPARSRLTVSSHPRLLDDAATRRLATVPVDAGVAAVASAQGGPLSVRQLALLGLDKDAIHQRKLAGRLFSPLRGVLALADMNGKRAYTMRVRAEAVEATRRRVLEATFELAQRRRIADIGLDAVAVAAGVSVQTVLRQFGSRAGLLTASMEHANRVVGEERATPPGDVDQAVRVVVDHYELRGDTSLLLLSQEDEEAVRPIVEAGKAGHRQWVREAFAPFDADEDLLVVATDVYTWKLLRRDRGHSRARTEALMSQLVRALLTDRSP